MRAVFEKLWDAALDGKPRPHRGRDHQRGPRGEIRGMYVMGENPAMSDPDVHHAREALAKLEHLVVQDIFLTETARYADVVLPASAWPEKTGTVTNTNRQVQLGRRALPLPGEAREDLWIIQELARRIGLDWHYTHPRDVFAEMKPAMPSLDNITWERLEREGSVTYPCDAEDQPGQRHRLRRRLPDASGRGQARSGGDRAAGRGAGRGLPDGAHHRPPARALAHRRHDAARKRARRARARGGGEPRAGRSAPHGVGAGALIRVATRRGAIELKARADGAVPPGMVFIPFCYAEAAANLLTSPQLDPFGKIPNSNSAPRRSSPPPPARPSKSGSITGIAPLRPSAMTERAVHC